MKSIKIYIILLGLIMSFPIFSANMLQKANEAFAAEKYNEAIELYEKILKNEGESSELYYNLGNAYYKEKKYADAILNYERSLLLSPRNTDAQFNLEMAKAQITDKIEPVNEFFLTMWVKNLSAAFSSNTWAILSVICFVLFIVCASVYYYSRHILLKKIGFFMGLFMFLFVIVGNIFAANQKDKLEIHNEAIIFAPSLVVKSTPADSGTDLFILHEGTKVSVISTLGKWSEIRVPDGNQGWVPTEKIQII